MEVHGNPSGDSRTDRGLLLSVSLCLVLSGTASLSLQIVWSRLLKLVFGSTTLAITTILVAYMLGLGLGGLLGGRIVRRMQNGVRAYGWMEIGVGLYALLVPAVLGAFPWLDREVLSSFSFWPAALLRFVVVLLVLLVPTLFMGATLPVLVQALARSRARLGRRVGLLYGLNTLGAVSGCLLTTFVLFPRLGVARTNLVGAGLDVLVGLVAVFFLAPRLPALPGEPEVREPATPAPAPRPRRRDPVLLAYALVGFTALAYEVAWTRALSMILGSSIYAFATMLAGFLAGISLGSLLAQPWLDRVRRPRAAFAVGVLLLGVAALWTFAGLRALPGLFLALVEEHGVTGQSLVWISLGFSFCVMLAPTLVLGALFPLVARATESADRPTGTTVGEVYFANTLGSAAGAFCAGFVLIPWLGLQRGLAAITAVDFALAGLLLTTVFRREVGYALRIAGAGALGGALWLTLAPPVWDSEELAGGVYYRPEARMDFGLPRLSLEGVPDDRMLFFEEGINTTVSVHRAAGGLAEGGISLRLNGKTDASLADMSTQVLSGHLPLVFGGPVKTALVIGYASGVTTGAVSLHGLERIDVCEIEPAVVRASRFFDEVNHRPLERDDVHLILDDGRTWLSTTRRAYDVVISEPSNPWITGCSNLFTEEFFAAVRARLNPGGRLLQWIQLYGMSPEGLRSILAALHESFGFAYGFLAHAEDTDLLLIATDEPLELDDLPRWEELPAEVQDDLRSVGHHSTADLWSLCFLEPDACARLALEARHENTDDSMYVELDTPWHLYEDTPETAALLHERARGLLPLLSAAPETDAPTPALVGELANAYAFERGFTDLGQALVREAERRGDVALVSTFEADRLVASGGNPRGALELLDRAVASAGAAYLPRMRRAALLCEGGAYERALGDIEVALQSRPGDLRARHLRVKALGTLGRNEEAWAEVRELLAGPLVEEDPYLLAEAARIAAPVGELDRARRDLERFLELEPDSPVGWSMRAQLEEHAGDVGAALRSATNAERARTNQLRELHRAARWQESLGSLEEAERTLEIVTQLDPSYEPAARDLERLRAAR